MFYLEHMCGVVAAMATVIWNGMGRRVSYYKDQLHRQDNRCTLSMGMGSSQASIVGRLHDRLIPSGAS